MLGIMIKNIHKHIYIFTLTYTQLHIYKNRFIPQIRYLHIHNCPAPQTSYSDNKLPKNRKLNPNHPNVNKTLITLGMIKNIHKDIYIFTLTYTQLHIYKKRYIPQIRYLQIRNCRDHLLKFKHEQYTSQLKVMSFYLQQHVLM